MGLARGGTPSQPTSSASRPAARARHRLILIRLVEAVSMQAPLPQVSDTFPALKGV